MVLNVNAVSLGVLASGVLVSDQSDTFSADLAFLSCQPEDDAVVYFQDDTMQTYGNCWGKATELLVCFLMKC